MLVFRPAGTSSMEVIMKEHFLDRLYGEYQAYRASLLGTVAK